ncbi:hypothetical protein ABZY03_18405 [Streptomyces klenkii]|uniref:hypothetical protein n=1 Tax=Streptomyces klenkii TaxID=1420899 RepID=UPI0033B10FE9
MTNVSAHRRLHHTIRDLLARHRLAIHYWAGWVSTSRSGRTVGPRPVLALHRLPDPDCTTCGGTGEVTCAGPDADEPGYDDCYCAPFQPLAFIRLLKPPSFPRRRRPAAHDPWYADPDCAHDQALF